MERIKHWARHLWRVSPLLVIGLPLWYGLLTGAQAKLVAPLDTIFLKALLGVTGVLVAHVVRKWLIPVPIAWTSELAADYFKWLTVALVLCFAFGA